MQDSGQNTGCEQLQLSTGAELPSPSEMPAKPLEDSSGAASRQPTINESNPEPTAKLISELVTDPEFPRNALSQRVDIGGYVGVVVDIVRNSIKVRSSEGITMSYNINALRRLYGPHVPVEPLAPTQEPAAPAPPPQPKREVILNPNFDAPLKPIEQFVNRPDFPKCAYGEYVDMRGYLGVVVEIVGRSLKVRSREGTTRSYNADGLRKIFANPSPTAGEARG
jgi:hypothetical protein